MRALLWLVIGAAAADYTCDVSPAALEQIVARASATLGGDYVVAHGVWNWSIGDISNPDGGYGAAIFDDAAKFPGRAGAALGALTAGSRGASLVVPVLTGALIGTSLSVGAAMAIVALPCVVGLYLVESRPRRRKQGERLWADHR